jgi:hypothetical protein
MFDYRYAVVDGVPSGARGGFVFESLYRHSGPAQVSDRGASAPRRTIRRGRHVRGIWLGEHGLRLNAVFLVQRHPVTIPSLVNKKEESETKNKQTYSTQGVGITANALAKKVSPAGGGEAMGADCGHKDHRLAAQAFLVRQGSSRPFSLNQFLEYIRT